MTLGGWINLLLSVGFVTVLFGYCVWRVLTGPKKSHTLAHVEPIDESKIDRR
ncbi:MAG TPA: hypothetical protein PKX00_10015 [Opitutaceae bacterium]|jgi:hypothetical protein|nr:hypothetical protein [Opitutaceae bacterium]HRE05934.1 hypothetical protein [Opitutaceae bacterium]